MLEVEFIMQFFIINGQIKRRLGGTFQICADRKAFEHLVREITRHLETGHDYGRIQINEPMDDPIAIDSRPKRWDE